MAESHLFLLIFMIHDDMLYIDVHDANNDVDVALFSPIDVYSIYLCFPIIISTYMSR